MRATVAQRFNVFDAPVRLVMMKVAIAKKTVGQKA